MSGADRPQLAAMPWYPRDFRSSTLGWPLEARAIYRELLDAQWDSGGLPNNPSVLMGICGCSEHAWSIAWVFLEEKFTLCDDGKLRNERLESHRSTAVDRATKAREKARKAAQSRWGDAQGNAASNAPSTAQAKREQCPPSPSPSPSPSPEDTGAAAPRRRSRPKPPDEFGEIREAYPKRFGGQRWDDAIRGYRRAIAEGHTHAELLAAVQGYAKHCDVAGKTGTDKVQQAGTFFGKNRGFLEEYDTTPQKGSKQSLAEEAKQEQERKDVKYLADLFRTEQGEGESYEAFRERLFAMNKRRIEALGGDVASKLKSGGAR